MKKTINEIHIRFRGNFPIREKISDGDVVFLVKGASEEKKIKNNHDGSVDITYVVDIVDGERVVDKDT